MTILIKLLITIYTNGDASNKKIIPLNIIDILIVIVLF